MEVERKQEGIELRLEKVRGHKEPEDKKKKLQVGPEDYQRALTLLCQGLRIPTCKVQEL
jgi:hypothetical protein